MTCVYYNLYVDIRVCVDNNVHNWLCINFLHQETQGLLQLIKHYNMIRAPLERSGKLTISSWLLKDSLSFDEQ